MCAFVTLNKKITYLLSSTGRRTQWPLIHALWDGSFAVLESSRSPSVSHDSWPTTIESSLIVSEVTAADKSTQVTSSLASVYSNSVLCARRHKPKVHGSSFPVASSPTRPTSSRGCYEDVARVGWLPRSACHALTWLVGRRSAAVYSAARLSVCRVVLITPPARRARLVANKSLASS